MSFVRNVSIKQSVSELKLQLGIYEQEPMWRALGDSEVWQDIMDLCYK